VSKLTKYDIIEILITNLSDAYFCTRVWEAWQVNTMTEGDFQSVDEDDRTLEDIAEEILAKIKETGQ
jgi:hypothetical protein